jgi:hypothetical protein
MGVPSSISTPRTDSRGPSRWSSSTIVSAIGFGRRGDLVANTPWGRSSDGGVPSNSNPCARSNTHNTIKCENPSMSMSPVSNSGRISRVPSAWCFVPSPFGTSCVVLYGLRTYPMGRRENMQRVYRRSRPLFTVPSSRIPVEEALQSACGAAFDRA